MNLKHLQAPYRNSNDMVACVQNSDTHCSSSAQPDSSQTAETQCCWPDLHLNQVIQGCKTEDPISNHLQSSKDFTCSGAPASCGNGQGREFPFCCSGFMPLIPAEKQKTVSHQHGTPSAWHTDMAAPTCYFKGCTKLHNSPGKHHEDLKLPFWRWPPKTGTLPPNIHSLWLGIRRHCLITLKTVSQGPDLVHMSGVDF